MPTVAKLLVICWSQTWFTITWPTFNSVTNTWSTASLSNTQPTYPENTFLFHALDQHLVTMHFCSLLSLFALMTNPWSTKNWKMTPLMVVGVAIGLVVEDTERVLFVAMVTSVEFIHWIGCGVLNGGGKKDINCMLFHACCRQLLLRLFPWSLIVAWVHVDLPPLLLPCSAALTLSLLPTASPVVVAFHLVTLPSCVEIIVAAVLMIPFRYCLFGVKPSFKHVLEF